MTGATRIVGVVEQLRMKREAPTRSMELNAFPISTSAASVIHLRGLCGDEAPMPLLAHDSDRDG